MPYGLSTGEPIYYDALNAPAGVSADSGAPSGLWDAIKQFFSSSIPTSTLAANYYEAINYGQIPQLQNAPVAPVAGAPQTQQQMTDPTAWNPQTAAAAGKTAYEQGLRDWLTSQAASGSWNPAGRLPVSATDVSNFSSNWGALLIAGGLVAGALLLVNVVRR